MLAQHLRYWLALLCGGLCSFVAISKAARLRDTMPSSKTENPRKKSTNWSKKGKDSSACGHIINRKRLRACGCSDPLLRSLT
jgi:hypothetical protein